MTLYEEYISGYKNFESQLLILDEDTRRKIINMLKRERNRTNFLSRITEIDFGLFYAQNGAVVEYQKKYELKEPDWTITLNNQTFLSEVLRLNPTKKDSDRNEFEMRLMNQVNQIEGSYYLKIDYQDEYFRVTEFDPKSIAQELALWFLEKRDLHEQITLFGNFTFTIAKVNTNKETVQPIGNVNSVDVDKRRLESTNSEFYRKIDKYIEVVDKREMPFIISLHSDFKNGIDTDDLFSFLYGSSVDNRITNSVYTDYTDGLFYSNANAKKYLSGVLLKKDGKFTFFYNHYKENRLNANNQSFLKSFK